MKTELIIRPSTLDRVMACPGSAHAEAPFPPDAGNEHTERGIKLHSGMALVFRIGLVNALKKLAVTEGWIPEDLATIKEAYDLALPILGVDLNQPGDTWELLVEKSLDLSQLGITDGERRADIILLNFATRQVLILDWKFGASEVNDPRQNYQIKVYGIGALLEQKKGLFDAVNLAIIQPAAWRQDDKVREDTMTIQELHAEMKAITSGVALARKPGQELNASKKTCQWCRAKPNCQAFKSMKDAEDASKVQTREDQVVNDGGEAIMVNLPEGVTMELPMVVISADLVKKAQGYYDEALDFKVVDLATAEEAGKRAKGARKLLTLIDDQRKTVKELPLKLCQDIDAAPKPATDLLKKGEAHYADESLAWFKEEHRRNQAIEAARLMQVREFQEAQAKADEAARVAAEAQAKADRARKPETQDAAQAKADEAANAAAQAQAEVQQAGMRLANTMATAPAAPAMKVSGFGTKEVTIATVPNLALIPPAYVPMILVVDQKKLDALVAAGVLNEETGKGWLVLTKDLALKRTR